MSARKGSLQSETQSIRQYYDFDVDVDRYDINGVETQVYRSAREINVPT